MASQRSFDDPLVLPPNISKDELFNVRIDDSPPSLTPNRYGTLCQDSVVVMTTRPPVQPGVNLPACQFGQ